MTSAQSPCHSEVEKIATSRPVLTRKEAAAYLSISPQTLAAWASNRRVSIPFSHLGRRVVYRLADLDAFIAANRHGQPVPKEALQ